MNIWQYKFKSFKQAQRYQKGKGFSGAKWKQSQLKILINCKKAIQLNKKLPHNYTNRYKNFLLILKKYFKKKKDLQVLDYGGGIGVGYFYLLQNLDKKLNYTIVEIPSFVKNINKSRELKIKYKTKISSNNFDVIICCSVFQYINDWKKKIKKLTATKTKYIYFADMFVGNIISYVSLQNYYKSKIPHRFINYNDFNNEMVKNKYKLISKSKMKTKRLNFKNKLPMNNFSYDDRIDHTLNLLYKKV